MNDSSRIELAERLHAAGDLLQGFAAWMLNGTICDAQSGHVRRDLRVAIDQLERDGDPLRLAPRLRAVMSTLSSTLSETSKLKNRSGRRSPLLASQSKPAADQEPK